MDTGRSGVRTSVEHALRGLLWDKVPRNHRQDPRPFLVRRVVTGVFVVIGAVVLGWSLQIDAGDSTFYVATLVLAAIWTIGAFASGPLYLGGSRARGGTTTCARPSPARSCSAWCWPASSSSEPSWCGRSRWSTGRSPAS